MHVHCTHVRTPSTSMPSSKSYCFNQFCVRIFPLHSFLSLAMCRAKFMKLWVFSLCCLRFMQFFRALKCFFFFFSVKSHRSANFETVVGTLNVLPMHRIVGALLCFYLFYWRSNFFYIPPSLTFSLFQSVYASKDHRNEVRFVIDYGCQWFCL